MMILTIDIGNSRIKGARWQTGEIVDRAVVTRDSDKPVEVFDQLFSALGLLSCEGDAQPEPSRVFAICVAGVEVRQSLSAYIEQRWQLAVDYLETEKRYQNIVNAYHDPSQHGVDRWAGMVAAYLRYPGSSICVIGAGTAITFDLLRQDGRHLGGYILPSYNTMHTALLADTTHVVSASDKKYKKQGVPDNTNDAVNQGLHRLLQAGIREMCQHAQSVLQCEQQDGHGVPVKIILTGGFAETILSYPDMPAMQHQPDLVMQGLYDMLKQRKPEVGS